MTGCCHFVLHATYASLICIAVVVSAYSIQYMHPLPAKMTLEKVPPSLSQDTAYAGVQTVLSREVKTPDMTAQFA